MSTPFEADLSPERVVYQLNTKPFVYNNRDLDTFRIELRSLSGAEYDVKIRAACQDRVDEGPRRAISTSLIVSFPGDDPEQAIRLVADMPPAMSSETIDCVARGRLPPPGPLLPP